jgi:hypothetical protein
MALGREIQALSREVPGGDSHFPQLWSISGSDIVRDRTKSDICFTASFVGPDLPLGEKRIGLRSQKRFSSLRLLSFLKYFPAKGNIPDR